MEKCRPLLFCCSPLRFIFRSILQKTQRTVDLRKTFWPLCSDQPNVWGVGSRYLEKFSNGARSGPSHDTAQSALVHETLFLQVFPFFPRVFISPFHTCKNGIRCSRKVSYKTIDTREENFARHNRANRVRSCTNVFRKGEENCYVSRLKKSFTLIIRCRSIFQSWWI